MARTHLAAWAVALGSSALALAASAGSAGCGDVLVRPIREVALEGGAPADDSSAGTTDGGMVDDGASGDDVDTGATDAAMACQPTVALPTTAGTTMCTGDLARVFRFAACACEDFNITAGLLTDTFDSTGDGGANAVAASIGTNGQVSTSNPGLGGSVWSGGAVALSGTGTIAGDIHCGADLGAGGSFDVAGNVFANGSVSDQEADAGESLAIGGTLHLPEGGTVSPGITAQGGVVYEPVQVDPPCDCSPIDVSGIVAAMQTNNDNATLSIATSALHYPTATVHLPCGRYYVDDITGSPVTIRVDGHVGLFVAGSLSDALQVDVAPDAELDVFVAGVVTIGSGAVLGSLTSPARVRVYVGNDLNLGDNTNIWANVYAPLAAIHGNDLTVQGALFARRFDVSGAFQIHYDPSVLGAAASGCTRPGGACSTCDDCPSGTPACIGGTCVACTKNSDCCAPLACSAGRCVQPGG